MDIFGDFSLFWNIWIIVPTLFVIACCFFILRACSQNNTGIEEGESMGHSFDGIEELNNPLPKWWAYMFYTSIVFGLIYLALYPGLGTYKGLFGWTSSNQSIGREEGIKLDSIKAIETAKAENRLSQYDREVASADEKYGPIFAAYLATPLEDLVKDKEALKVGGRLFLQNCAQCHGSDARGSTGFPNLTDNDWLYGGDPASIKATLMHGRNGVMPAWKDILGGDQGVKEMTSYVLQLSGRRVNAIEAQAGAEKFALCAACHGPEGKGIQAMGAPNLTDKVWLYGGSRKAVEDTIANGRNGVMPAWSKVLGEDKVHLISAFVYSLSLEK